MDELRPKTGEDQEVRDYVMQNGTADIFLNKLYDMLEFLIPGYVLEGKPACDCDWLYRRKAPVGDDCEGGLRAAQIP